MATSIVVTAIAIVLWRDSNNKQLASFSLGRLSSRGVSQQFYVGPDRFIIHDVFLSVFWWLYCSNIGWARAYVPI